MQYMTVKLFNEQLVLEIWQTSVFKQKWDIKQYLIVKFIYYIQICICLHVIINSASIRLHLHMYYNGYQNEFLVLQNSMSSYVLRIYRLKQNQR